MSFDAPLLSFTVLAILLAIAPGADTALVMKNALTRGRLAGMLTTVGICLGCLVHAVASSLGLSLILAQSAQVFTLVKLVGSAYLIWIGIQTLRNSGAAAGESAPPGPGRATPERRSFAEGLLTNLLNPKVALFYLLVLPQFVRVQDDVLQRSLLLASIHIAAGTVWLSGVVLAVDRLRGVLGRRRVRLFTERLLGVALTALGVRLAFARPQS